MIARVFACLAVLVVAAFADGDMVCFPSAPTAAAGAAVTLSAYYNDPKAQFIWKADGGAVKTANGATVWGLAGVDPGVLTADVTAMVNGVKAAACSVELLVTVPTKKRDTPSTVPIASVGTRSFLIRGGHEDTGYGLFSYILFAAKPNDKDTAERDRYMAIFDAARRLLHPVETQLGNYKKAQLNATWLPIKVAPAGDPDAKWLFDNYDYDSAAGLIAKAGITGNPQGIYIVSVSQPLTAVVPKQPFLTQNLSRVTGPLADTWITMFINQAAQVHYWNRNTIDQLVAHMRLGIAIAAEGVPDVKGAVATLIGLGK